MNSGSIVHKDQSSEIILVKYGNVKLNLYFHHYITQF